MINVALAKQKGFPESPATEVGEGGLFSEMRINHSCRGRPPQGCRSQRGFFSSPNWSRPVGGIDVSRPGRDGSGRGAGHARAGLSGRSLDGGGTGGIFYFDRLRRAFNEIPRFAAVDDASVGNRSGPREGGPAAGSSQFVEIHGETRCLHFPGETVLPCPWLIERDINDAM